MAEWKTTGSAFDLNEEDEFIIYEAGDVKKERALKLTREGKLIARRFEDANGGAMVPLGAIVMWSGDVSNIPAGFVLCDGQNGTPNLVSRFIRGASATGEPKPGTSGGSDSHTHQASALVNIQPAGNHQHKMPPEWYSNWADNGKNVTIIDRRATEVADARTQASGEHVHAATSSVTIQAESHLPNWYALCFIMRKS